MKHESRGKDRMVKGNRQTLKTLWQQRNRRTRGQTKQENGGKDWVGKGNKQALSILGMQEGSEMG